MHIINNILKVIAGLVGAVVAFGCNHPKGEYNKPAEEPAAVKDEPAQAPVKAEPLPKGDEEPTSIYGPPEAFGFPAEPEPEPAEAEPLPKSDEEPTDIYGPPEAFGFPAEPEPEPAEAEPLPKIDEDAEPELPPSRNKKKKVRSVWSGGHKAVYYYGPRPN